VSKRYPLHDAYSLCRCGHSKDKPFCDYSQRSAFRRHGGASREHYLSRAEEVDGPGLILNDVRDLCSQVGTCNRAGGIRELTLYSDDPEARRVAIEEVANCNSVASWRWIKKTGTPLSLSWNPQSQWLRSR